MDSKNKKYKIFLSGGGTGGSVAPLLAVYDELNNPPTPLYKGGEFEFLWLGTRFGPEKQMVEQAGIKFKAITGGKWRRYFSLKNLLDIFKIKIAFWQSFFILLKWRPDLAISAGSFISVPAVWAAWLLGAKVLVHQQDVRPGLANRLMAPLAKVVTVTFEKSLADYGKKAIWTGNPVRQELRITPTKGFMPEADKGSASGRNYELRINNFKINKSLPVVLILGGGTGAMAINKLVEDSLGELTKFCQIIQVTGKEKAITNYANQRFHARGRQGVSLWPKLRITNYAQYEFLDVKRMAEALKLADIVVTRAGMSFLSELSYLGKPAILIPLPDLHQEDNAAVFNQAQAAVVLKQKELTTGKLVDEIKNLINNKDLQKKLSQNIGRVMKQGANEAMVKIILDLLS